MPIKSPNSSCVIFNRLRNSFIFSADKTTCYTPLQFASNSSILFLPNTSILERGHIVKQIQQKNISVYKERDGDMTLGGRIREIRKSRKVTQKEFSERICATQSYVSRLEADKAQPTDMLIKLIALEFQVSFHWLAYGEGELEISEAIFDYWDRTSTEELGEGAESGLVVFSRKLKEYNNASLYTGVSSIIGDISDVLDLYKNNIGFLTLLMEELWSICLAFTEMVKTLNTEAEKTRAIMNQTLIVKDKELLKSIRNESLSFLDTTRDSVKSIERLYLQWLKI